MSHKMTSVVSSKVPLTDEAVYDLLIIDGDPAAIQLVTDVLERERYRIHGATNAVVGLDLIIQRRPRVVLLDLVILGAQGMELLDRILGVDPSIDVILVTGHYS